VKCKHGGGSPSSRKVISIIDENFDMKGRTIKLVIPIQTQENENGQTLYSCVV